MTDSYIYCIVALLPLAASMVVVQTNPYHALILRGVLGAISALIYAILGAADVALTEALVGTLLAVTLYAITVRSSLVFRLGVLQQEDEAMQTHPDGVEQHDFQQLLTTLRRLFKPYSMQVEWITYDDRGALLKAMKNREIHATWLPVDDLASPTPTHTITVRIPRLYEILQSGMDSPNVRLIYVDLGTSVNLGTSVAALPTLNSAPANSQERQ